MTESERRRVFGQPCQSSSYVSVTTVWGIRVKCHPLLVEHLKAACVAAAKASRWTPRRIDSYACRDIRDSSATSLHSYALAWDFFDVPITQQPDVWGPTNAPDEAFRQAFRDHDFFCGADFGGRKDYPHIEWGAGKPAPLATSASAPAPVLPPPTVTDFPTGEDMLRRIDVTIATDSNGNGWTTVDAPADTVVSIVAQGPYPPDNNYWNLPVFGRQSRDGKTVVTVTEAMAAAALPVSVWVVG